MSTQQEPQPTPKTKHNMSYAEAYQAQQHYRCAGCYEPVVAQRTERSTEQHAETWTAECATTDCNTPGFVTTGWVERQKDKNREQAMEARDVLSQAAPWMNPHRGKTDTQLLAELGF